jgi:hypothetical protein
MKQAVVGLAVFNESYGLFKIDLDMYTICSLSRSWRLIKLSLIEHMAICVKNIQDKAYNCNIQLNVSMLENVSKLRLRLYNMELACHQLSQCDGCSLDCSQISKHTMCESVWNFREGVSRASVVFKCFVWQRSSRDVFSNARCVVRPNLDVYLSSTRLYRLQVGLKPTFALSFSKWSLCQLSTWCLQCCICDYLYNLLENVPDMYNILWSKVILWFCFPVLFKVQYLAKRLYQLAYWSAKPCCSNYFVFQYLWAVSSPTLESMRFVQCN